MRVLIDWLIGQTWSKYYTITYSSQRNTTCQGQYQNCHQQASFKLSQTRSKAAPHRSWNQTGGDVWMQVFWIHSFWRQLDSLSNHDFWKAGAYLKYLALLWKSLKDYLESSMTSTAQLLHEGQKLANRSPEWGDVGLQEVILTYSIVQYLLLRSTTSSHPSYYHPENLCQRKKY